MSEHTPAVEPISTFIPHTGRRAAMFPAVSAAIRIADPVSAYSLVQYQTPFQNQGSRGSCWAFAAAAAMEAAYKRQYGIKLDLSEEYIYSVEKTLEVGDGTGADLPGPRETNSSFWDFQGASDVLLMLPAYAVCEEKYAPYVNNVSALLANIPAAGALPLGGATQEQIDAFEYNQALIPLPARWNAKYRVTGSKTVWSGSGDAVTAIVAEISNNREVVIGLQVGNGGDDNLQANPGVGGHVTLVVGFDNNAQQFLIKNSWGLPLNPVTGQLTYAVLSYATLRKYISGAHAITSIADPNAPVETAAAWRGIWEMNHDGWRGRLVIRRTFSYENYVASLAGKPNTLTNAQNSTRVGSYYRDGLRHDVNGHFENGGTKLVCFVADETGSHIKPGQESGQRFEFYLFSHDQGTAAGQTTWQNTPFGAYLSRTHAPGTPASFNVADWKGFWRISHDGWQGTLNIIAASPSGVIAVYTGADGMEHPAPGHLGNRPHIINLTVQFSNANHQPFTLLAHTRETGVFAGTTTLGGATYGVLGTRLRPIYAVQPHGELFWYLHQGRVQANTKWDGAKTVGGGWYLEADPETGGEPNFVKVFSGGDGILYAVQKDGTLLWYRHVDPQGGIANFAGPKSVGTGWQTFSNIIGAGNGVVYAIRDDGHLLWYRHDGRADGTFNWTGPIDVASGWGDFKFVFSGGDGILYAVTNDGTLIWRWHYGYADGSLTWSEPKTVGAGGWADMVRVFGADGGTIYAVEKDGLLMQYTHPGRLDGTGDIGSWKQVGTGWQNATEVLSS